MLKGERILHLTDHELASVCLSLEEKFKPKDKKLNADNIRYQLSSNIMRMGWLDSGKITFQRTGENIRLIYSISSKASFLFYGFIQVPFFIYQLFIVKSPEPAVVSLIIYPFLFILAYLGYFLFRLRVNKSVNEALSSRIDLSDEQKQWITDPDKCPACGHENISDKNECPECGLYLK